MTFLVLCLAILGLYTTDEGVDDILSYSIDDEVVDVIGLMKARDDDIKLFSLSSADIEVLMTYLVCCILYDEGVGDILGLLSTDDAGVDDKRSLLSTADKRRRVASLVSPRGQTSRSSPKRWYRPHF